MKSTNEKGKYTMDAIILIIAGLFTLILTILKPGFFWNHRKAIALRKRIGDGATSIIYLVIGGFCLIVGVLSWFVI